MAMLLQLSLCVVTLIQLTSSQSTYDVIPQDSDVSSCGGIEQVLSQLVRAVTRIQVALTQLQRDVAQLKSFNQENATSQMEKLKSCNQQGTVEGMPITTRT